MGDRTPNEILSRNFPYLKGVGPWRTALDAAKEAKFRGWLETANIHPGVFDPDAPQSDYDMRGFWMALQARDPRAVSALNPYDGRAHYPDTWKTPYHETFSNESIYAKPDVRGWDKKGKFHFTRQAPHWTEDGTQLLAPDGTVVWGLGAD